MTLTVVLYWLVTGLLAWIFNLKNIIRLAKNVVTGTTLAFWVGYHSVTFTAHVIGGSISLVLVLYSYYQNWREGAKA